ncbi:MAG: G/U mismatch-specific DNA glycosylase [Terracidiphilus sp.]
MKPIPTAGIKVCCCEAITPSSLQTNRIGLTDVISTSLNVLFCGINPGMRSAAVGLHFANRSNRFWRVLHLAGFTARQFEPKEARILLDYGCGITSAVDRPTVSATDLNRADYIAAQPAFERKIAKYRPRYLAFLGKPACSAFLNQRNLSWGLQPTALGGSAVWVLPSPSGLNRAFTIGKLTDAYRELFEEVALRGL